jgi:hypothetical protein
VLSDRIQSNDDASRVIQFRPSLDGSRGRHRGKTLIGNSEPNCSPVPDLAKYQDQESDDEYRHRMIVNAIALAFTSLLILAGVCLAIMVAHA